MKLLVANRAEIAVRILGTAAALGVPTVAVHPDDDADCAHVARADEAVRLPGVGAAAYLDVDEIVGAAVRTGCDTLHPGYGFLAENPALSRACAARGHRLRRPRPGDAGAVRGQDPHPRRAPASWGSPCSPAPRDPPTSRRPGRSWTRWVPAAR